MKCADCAGWNGEICCNPESIFYEWRRSGGNSCRKCSGKIKRCASCFYWQREPYSSGMVCVNGSGPFVGEWTTPDHVCRYWEAATCKL